jgi:hypothetical protein
MRGRFGSASRGHSLVMDDEKPFAPGGDEGETEAVNPPHQDDAPPTGSRAQPAAWLIGIAVVVLLLLGFLVAWGIGMLDAGTT